MKVLAVLRRNWKKTVLGVVVGSYALHYGWEMYKISNLMKSYSKTALSYGEQYHQYPQRVIVMLNPAANKKKSEKYFKKYCEPILHLAGLMVDIVRTDSEGHANAYMEQLKSLPNAVVIAGGDGTVSEVLTGIMRRTSDRCPIALLPLGIRNDVAKMHLNLSFSSKLDQIESLIKASMIIVRGCLAEKSVIKVEPISIAKYENSETKPIYAIGCVKWGIRRDIESLQEKYWYFGNAKTRCSVLLNAFNRHLSWSCKADVCYSLPCIGCTNCINSEIEKKRRTWWANIFLNNVSNRPDTVSNNGDCKVQYNDKIDSSNVSIYVDDKSNIKKLVLEQEGNLKPGYKFLQKYLIEPLMTSDVRRFIECRTITLVPDDNSKEDSKFYSIDNEMYDVRPISLTLIPKAIQLYV